MKDGEGARDRDWERDRNMIPIPPPLLLLLEGTWHGMAGKERAREKKHYCGWVGHCQHLLLF
jgi:hypothetical protein